MVSSRFFLCKQKTAYELRISDWSSDVCSSDLEGQRRAAEPLRLQRVVAMRQARVGRLHRADQGIDHLVLDEVGEIARGHRTIELPPPVLDLLVLGEGVGDQREHPRVVAQHLAERPGSLAPRRFLAIGQAVEDLRRGERLALEGKSQGRHGLRSEEHTSELQSLMRTSYAVFCLKKKK